MARQTTGLRSRWPGLLLAMLLVGAGAAEVPPPASPADVSLTPEAVMRPLNDALTWYRQARVVMRSVADSGGGLFAREGEDLALRLLQRGFDVARAKAALVSDARPHAAAQSDDVQQLNAAIAADEAELTRVRAELRRASASRKAALQRLEAATANRLELDRARLDFVVRLGASDASLTAAPDLAQQIQALQDAVPDLKVTTGTPAVPLPAADVEAASHTISLLRRLLALRRSRTSLEELAVATSALSSTVDKDVRTVRELSNPVDQRLQELTRDPSGGSASLPEGARQFRDLLERSKRLAAVTVALRQQGALADRYVDELDGWERALDRQTRRMLQGLALDFIRVVVAFAAVVAAGALAGLAVRRYVADGYRQRLLLGLRNGAVIAAVILVAIFQFTTELAALVTALGFAAAGIAFALQNLILALAGYFSMAAPNGIRVGDRVSLQGPFGYVHGEVIEIGFVRMKLRELTADVPTGRIVVFPNSVVFTGTFFKDPPPHAAAA
jgi:ABC-type glycerol-3-phosphate transport system permease component